MSLKIIKLAETPNQKISILPTVTRLFHVVPEVISENSTHKIDASQFWDDGGEVVQELPTLNLNNSYFNVYINGALQMDDNFAYTAGEEGIGSLLLSVPEGSEILKGSPIIVEVINFNPVITSN
ncbi:DUF4183 domain-containing protein [Paenisporosarcina sp. NPDC076898]|uniref:DUF4183 domain-containing protein n=1 Tax=unclassified Paenisporosarcina TaxID=2642018 RepID=UPI003D03DA2B